MLIVKRPHAGAYLTHETDFQTFKRPSLWLPLYLSYKQRIRSPRWSLSNRCHANRSEYDVTTSLTST